MEDRIGKWRNAREGGGLKPDRQPHLLLVVWKQLWRFSTLNSDKFHVTTSHCQKDSHLAEMIYMLNSQI
jgi:hypothetical protein